MINHTQAFGTDVDGNVLGEVLAENVHRTNNFTDEENKYISECMLNPEGLHKFASPYCTIYKNSASFILDEYA